MTSLDPKVTLMSKNKGAAHAVVIGAGIGGLGAAMRLGAKGYRVSVIDRLDRLGGRGSSISKDGHRFDLGPTIITVPQVFRQLWQECGREFDKEVELRPCNPFYEIRWSDGTKFRLLPDEQVVDDARLIGVQSHWPKRVLAEHSFSVNPRNHRLRYHCETCGTVEVDE